MSISQSRCTIPEGFVFLFVASIEELESWAMVVRLTKLGQKSKFSFVVNGKYLGAKQEALSGPVANALRFFQTSTAKILCCHKCSQIQFYHA